MTKLITRHEQEQLGLIRPSASQPPAFVPADKITRIEPLPAHSVAMDITHPASQQVIVQTSARDRAAGFQMIITPIALVVAFLAVVVSIAFENQWFSFASLLIFWLTFVAVYVAGWVLTAIATPEFVSWYGAKRQWDVIEKEQLERWQHYRWQTGRVSTQAATSWAVRNWPLVLLAGLVWLSGVFLFVLWGGV
jgi:uncharacterized membrane protein (DUF485 family)